MSTRRMLIGLAVLLLTATPLVAQSEWREVTISPPTECCECDNCQCDPCECLDGECGVSPSPQEGFSGKVSLAGLVADSSADEYLTTNPAEASYRVWQRASDGAYQGSATAISPRWLVTNSHVVGHRLHSWEKKTLAIMGNGVSSYVDVCSFNVDADIALLKLPNNSTLNLKYADLGTLQNGQSITTWGYGASGVLEGRQGTMTHRNAYYDTGMSIPLYEMSTLVEQGDSGGGNFDEYGRLVSMTATSTTPGGRSPGGSVGADKILEVIDHWEAQYCANGRCLPIRRSVYQPAVSYRPPAPVPSTNPTPPTVSPPPVAPVKEVDLDKVAELLFEKMKENPELFKGDKGDQGEQGDTPAIDYDSLGEQVAAQLKANPITIEFQGSEGTIARTTTVRLGETLTIPPLRMEIVEGDRVEFQERPLGGILSMESDNKVPVETGSNLD